MSETRYRRINNPAKKQQLQLLYPGRLMERCYHYSGDNVPSNCPIKLQEQLMIRNQECKEQLQNLENAVKIKPGYPQRIPVVVPDLVPQDPILAKSNI